MSRRAIHLVRQTAVLGICLVTIFNSSPLFGDAVSWTGSVSDLWSDAANWSSNTVPNSTSDVTIGSSMNNPVQLDIDSVLVDQLDIGLGSSLDLDDGTVNVAGMQPVEVSGLIEGPGMITAGGPLNVSSGTIEVGPGGPFIFQGDLSLGATTTPSEVIDQIGGSSEADYGSIDPGLLSISDTTLILDDLNGFTPTNGETFVVASTGGRITGTFNDNTISFAGGTFSVEYSPAGYTNDVVLVWEAPASSVPEPPTRLLFALSLAGLGAYSFLIRRRSPPQQPY